jgi:hypothetical protein
MGITIHYRAVIRCDGSYIDELFDRLENVLRSDAILNIKRIDGFEKEYDFEKAKTAINELPLPSSLDGNPFIYTHYPVSKEQLCPEHRKVLVANIHPGCETFKLEFIKQKEQDVWIMPYSFVKTQFAPVWVHIFICSLLCQVESMVRAKGGSFNLNDEGDYYYSKDPKKLYESMRYVDSLIGRIMGALSDSKL